MTNVGRRHISYQRSALLNEVVIVDAVRTPIGSFQSSLSSLSATQLGGVAVKGLLDRTGIEPEKVNEVYMGNVCSAGLGQAPARQSAIFAGLPDKTICTTVHKVCASGLKAVKLAFHTLMLGRKVLYERYIYIYMLILYCKIHTPLTAINVAPNHGQRICLKMKSFQ